MHFHLPKPLHGWREFAGEVGIIVIGVLIALGAEQALEKFHWSEKAHRSREALRGEVGSLYRYSAERVLETPCLNAQLDQLKNAVLRAGPQIAPVPTYPTPSGPTVFRHSARLWEDSIWQSTITEQVSSHFSDDEREALASLYGSIVIARGLNRDELGADGALLTMASPVPLDPGVRAHLVEVIESERIRAGNMNLIAGQQMDEAKEVFPQIDQSLDRDWQRSMLKPTSTIGWCQAHHLPLGTLAH